MQEQSTDGRRAKGERRRQELIEATLPVVAREGVAGVRHRTVARAAGQPATAAASYLQEHRRPADRGPDLLHGRDAARMGQLAADGNGADAGLCTLARLMAEVVATPDRLLAEYELCLLAARRPGLRKPTQRWLAALADFARGYTSSPYGSRSSSV